MIICDPGDIFLVRFPFSESSNTKKRPALILSIGESNKSFGLVTVAMISSQVQSTKLLGDLLLVDWVSENLLHPSILRLSKVATLDRKLLISKLGTISKKDYVSAKKEFNKVFSYWH
jgi:mRNA interferase MazF